MGESHITWSWMSVLLYMRALSRLSDLRFLTTVCNDLRARQRRLRIPIIGFSRGQSDWMVHWTTSQSSRGPLDHEPVEPWSIGPRASRAVVQWTTSQSSLGQFDHEPIKPRQRQSRAIRAQDNHAVSSMDRARRIKEKLFTQNSENLSLIRKKKNI